jgi:pimeloyl-ACP methyl ester carboxylesterase
VEGSVAPGYLLSEDEAHSVLDSTRAFPKLVKNAPSNVAFVGHSQGGHAVLSAQALASTYGMSGQLKGVAAFAPFWAPGRTLGVVASPAAMYSVQDSPEQIKFAIEYFYTHAEVYDGPGAGSALFQPQAQAPLQALVSSCALLTPPPDALGSTTDTFFIQDIYDSVGNCGLDRSLCNDEGGAATKWEARFQADRPKLNASGAPIVLWQGKADQTIAPQLAKCGIDKIESDLPNGSAAKFTLCGDKMADHQSILSRRTHWVIRWIKARTLGRTEPKACNGEEAISDPGTPLACLTPPGNDD